MIRDGIARVGDGLDRHWRWVLVALTTGLVVVLVSRARAKLFWHDEVFTILASRLPLRTLWTASRDGLDLAPPLNTVLTRLVHAALGVGPVVTRLPPMIGFISACLLLFVMVRRRSNVWVALAAAVLPYFSGAFEYAFEARGYCVTLGCFALALFGWSEAAAGRHRGRNLLVMAVALAAGVWTHYYAILSFLPIVTGEFVRQRGHRRFDRLPWTALAAAAVSTLPLMPLLRASRAQAPTFWTRLEPFGLRVTYDAVLGNLLTRRFTIGAAVIVAIVVMESIRTRPERRPSSRRLEAHEVAAGLVTLAIPAAAMLVSELTKWAPVPVLEYAGFVRDHRRFQIYVCGSDWLTMRLRGDGAVFTRMTYELGCWLYRVRLPDR